MGGKKDKAARQAVKDRKAEKQSKKNARKFVKESGLTEESIPIDEILAKWEEEKKASLKNTNGVKVVATISPCEQPGPRSAFSFTAIPGGNFLLFGGEYFDGATCNVYNELYRLDPSTMAWKAIQNIEEPKPRCSHQCVIYKDDMYMFGGEFATIGQFYHYKDLWKFNLKTFTWEELKKPTGKPPTGRSGHRMVVCRNYIVLFGGFFDTYKETRYLNDLYLFVPSSVTWIKVQFSSVASLPAPRSSFCMAAAMDGTGLLVHGGYSKVKDTDRGAQGKVHNDTWWLDLKCIFGDNGKLSETQLSNIRWERVSKKGIVPPKRSAATMIAYKNLAIIFGGVFDEDEGGYTLKKTYFFNELHGFDLVRKRWYPMTLCSRPSKKPTSKKEQKCSSTKIQPDKSIRDLTSENPDEEDLSNTMLLPDTDDEFSDDYFAYIDQDGKLVRVKLTNDEIDEENVEVEKAEHKKTTVVVPKLIDETVSSPTEEVEDKRAGSKDEEVVLKKSVIDIRDEKPEDFRGTGECSSQSGKSDAVALEIRQDPTLLPRMNPGLAIKDNYLYVYGGLVEVGDRDLTLDDIWRIHLTKRDKWECLSKGTFEHQPWYYREESSCDESDDDNEASSDEGSTDSFDDESESDEPDEKVKCKKRTNHQVAKEKYEELQAVMSERRLELIESVKQDLCTDLIEGWKCFPESPNGGETLKEYFERTNVNWVDWVTDSIPRRQRRPQSAEDESLEENHAVDQRLRAHLATLPVQLTKSAKDVRAAAFTCASLFYKVVEDVVERLEELELKEANTEV